MFWIRILLVWNKSFFQTTDICFESSILWGKRKLNRSLDDVEETCPICEEEVEFDGAAFTSSTCDEGHKIQRCRQTFALIDPLSADLYRCQICGHMLNSTLFRWLFRLHAPGGCPVCNCLATRVSWPILWEMLLYTGELLWNFPLMLSTKKQKLIQLFWIHV